MTQVGENHRHKSIAFMDATNMLSRGWQMRLAQIYHKTRVCAYNQRLCTQRITNTTFSCFLSLSICFPLGIFATATNCFRQLSHVD